MENQVLRVQQIFEEKGLENKAISEMTLEEKGILLQLGIADPFAGEDPQIPNSKMSPEDKGALLLRYVKEKRYLFASDINMEAGPGQRWLIEKPYDFSSVKLHVLGLMNANLSKGNFTNADAENANLYGANLTETCLEGANLEGCYLGDAILRSCNLRNYRGFPSSVRSAIIDSLTYRLSNWTPEILKQWHHSGAQILGLDEFPKDAIQSILRDYHKIIPPKAFVSYAGCDENAAMHVATHLEKRGIRVWFAPWDIDFGDDIVSRIEDGLQSSAYFLIILSPEALNRPWVRQELSSALHKTLSELSGNIIPIMYKPCTPPPFLGSRKYLELRVPYIRPLEELVRIIRGEPAKREWDYSKLGQ